MSVDDIENLNELIAYISEGKQAEYLLFWGHSPAHADAVCKSCLSQWFDSPFVVDGVEYKTAEHYMMAQKATLFGDHISCQRIIASQEPSEAKKMGREIGNFNNDIWLKHRFDIVVQGNIHKFSQNIRLSDFLLGTLGKVPVEASPSDRIWGIGLSADSKDSENPLKWQGLNLLGFALMKVRKSLAI
jgi:ribA/ribD-fused uncharacterized protein